MSTTSYKNQINDTLKLDFKNASVIRILIIFSHAKHENYLKALVLSPVLWSTPENSNLFTYSVSTVGPT